MEPGFALYTLSWMLGVTLAAAFLFQTRSSQTLFQKAYLDFLFRPWKVITFLISGTVVTFLGPYTSDPTWDWVDGLIMSILTFLTAPWAVATIYRAFAGLTPKRNLFPAIFIWLFSASWSYDFYLYCRDGSYPSTWWSNLILSSILYFSAGLFWSLDWKPTIGVVFSFRQREWPSHNKSAVFLRIIWMGLPFVAIAAWLTLGFLKRH